MTSARAPHPSALGIPYGDLWVFGYGSLMWDPGFPFRKWAPALIFGYHRALCIASNRWRGTPERPGLVLGLERGGACHGIAFRVARRDVTTTLDALWAREMRRHAYRTRFLRVRLPDREVRALAFIADPAHAGHAGPLSVEETARRIANCHGARGPNLDYLVRTVRHLAELGVRDDNLLRVLAAVRALPAARRAAQGSREREPRALALLQSLFEADQTVAAYRFDTERKVRAPQGRVTANDRPPRGEEQGHRDQTADGHPTSRRASAAKSP